MRWVCSASHGQPPGERSRSITATRSSSRAPGRSHEPASSSTSGRSAPVVGAGGQLAGERVGQPGVAVGAEQPDHGSGGLAGAAQQAGRALRRGARRPRARAAARRPRPAPAPAGGRPRRRTPRPRRQRRPAGVRQQARRRPGAWWTAGPADGCPGALSGTRSAHGLAQPMADGDALGDGEALAEPVADRRTDRSFGEPADAQGGDVEDAVPRADRDADAPWPGGDVRRAPPRPARRAVLPGARLMPEGLLDQELAASVSSWSGGSHRPSCRERNCLASASRPPDAVDQLVDLALRDRDAASRAAAMSTSRGVDPELDLRLAAARRSPGPAPPSCDELRRRPPARPASTWLSVIRSCRRRPPQRRPRRGSHAGQRQHRGRSDRHGERRPAGA